MQMAYVGLNSTSNARGRAWNQGSDLLRHRVAPEEYAQRGLLVAKPGKHRPDVIKRNAGE
jgi:hypothetical protein